MPGHANPLASLGQRQQTLAHQRQALIETGMNEAEIVVQKGIGQRLEIPAPVDVGHAAAQHAPQQSIEPYRRPMNAVGARPVIAIVPTDFRAVGVFVQPIDDGCGVGLDGHGAAIGGASNRVAAPAVAAELAPISASLLMTVCVSITSGAHARLRLFRKPPWLVAPFWRSRS